LISIEEAPVIDTPHSARARRAIVPKSLIGVACLVALAACAVPGARQWQPIAGEAEKTNKVELTRLSHTVRFAAGASTLTPAETTSLLGFLDEADILYGDQLSLGMPADDALSQRRAAAIRRLLAKRGVLVTVSPAAMPVGAGPASGNAMTVQLERYVVTPPSCPNWSKPTGGDPDNTVFSNFGCATATNLGLMVAQPRDLLVGRQPGPPDADPELHAIQNYRAGKPITLPDDPTGQSTPGPSAVTPGTSAAGSGG
jgi:pilus assembly protein CpaD